jgi:HEAT repeat protein
VALLLDAWDEVATERRPLLRQQIEVMLRSYAGPVVLASRSSAASGFRDIAALELLAFERDEIAGYVEAWFPGKTAQHFLETLDAHKSINGLARIPLLLALLCRAFGDASRKLPLRRGGLCDLCLRGLLKQWKREDKAAEVDDLDVEASLADLGKIALALFPASQFTITEVATALQLPADKARQKIDDLIRDGILVPTGSRDDDRLTFLHRTFHEYLAAKEWSRQRWDQALFDTRSWDVTWSQVIVLMAGQLRDATAMIGGLLREVDDDIYRPRLALAIRCLQERLTPDRSSAMVDQATEAAVGLWLAHSRAGTDDALIRLEGALPALYELEGRYKGQDLLSYMTSANAADFLSLALAFGPEAATPETSGKVAALLGDPERRFRLAAAEVVARWGRRIASTEVVAGLIAMFRDDDFEAYDVALRAIVSLGEEGATPEILTLLTDPNPQPDYYFSWLGPDILAGMGARAATPDVLSRLLATLSQRQGSIRRAGGNRLSALGEHAAKPEVLRTILGLITNGERGVCRDAVEALIDLGPAAATTEVIAELVQLLRRPDTTLREAAIRALGAFSRYGTTGPALETLGDLLDDRNGEVRCFAALAIGAIGGAAASPAILNRLILLVDGSDWMARWGSVEALGKLGEPAATSAVLTRLVELLKSDDWVLRRMAQVALWRLAGVSSIAEVLPDLIALMSHSAAEVRIAAVSTVGAAILDEVTPQTVASMLQQTRDSDPRVAAASVESLAQLSDKIADLQQILKRAVEMSQHESPIVRAAAAEALGRFLGKEASPEALARVIDLLRDPDPTVPSQASAALAHMNEKAATSTSLSALAELVHHPDRLVATRAMDALSHLRDHAATPDILVAMLNMLRSDNSIDSLRGLYVLRHLGQRAATPDVLHRLVELGGDVELKTRVLEAIEHFGESAAVPEVFTWLRTMMDSSERSNRRAGAKTMRALQQAAPNARILVAETPRDSGRRVSTIFRTLLDRLKRNHETKQLHQ